MLLELAAAAALHAGTTPTPTPDPGPLSSLLRDGDGHRLVLDLPDVRSDIDICAVVKIGDLDADIAAKVRAALDNAHTDLPALRRAAHCDGRDGGAHTTTKPTAASMTTTMAAPTTTADNGADTTKVGDPVPLASGVTAPVGAPETGDGSTDPDAPAVPAGLLVAMLGALGLGGGLLRRFATR